MIFESLKCTFGEATIHRMALIASVASQVKRTMEAEFKDDEAGKQVAVDQVIELLQKK